MKYIASIFCLLLICGVVSNQFEMRRWKEGKGKGVSQLNGWPLVSTHRFTKPSHFDFKGKNWFSSLQSTDGEFEVEHNKISLLTNYLVIAALCCGSFTGAFLAVQCYTKGVSWGPFVVATVAGLGAVYGLFNYERSIVLGFFSILNMEVEGGPTLDLCWLGPIWDRLWYHQLPVLICTFLAVFSLIFLPLQYLFVGRDGLQEGHSVNGDPTSL